MVNIKYITHEEYIDHRKFCGEGYEHGFYFHEYAELLNIKDIQYIHNIVWLNAWSFKTIDNSVLSIVSYYIHQRGELKWVDILYETVDEKQHTIIIQYSNTGFFHIMGEHITHAGVIMIYKHFLNKQFN